MSIALLAAIVKNKSQYTKYKLDSKEFGSMSMCWTLNISLASQFSERVSSIRAPTEQINPPK